MLPLLFPHGFVERVVEEVGRGVTSVSFSHLAFITKPSIPDDSVDAHPGYWLDKTMQNV